MAGKGTISVNQSPQYGDKTALESAAQGMTETPMTGNPVPQRGAGRPETAQATPPGGEGPPIPGAHSEAVGSVAIRAWALQVWRDLAAQPGAGPRVKLYAQVAERSLREALLAARNATPYFE